MAGALVLIFLLDSLPAYLEQSSRFVIDESTPRPPEINFNTLLGIKPPTFGNTLNRTLEDVSPLGHRITNLRQCESRVTDPIIRAINKRLNLKIIPKWRPEHDTFNNLYLNESDETLYQLQAALDNSVENSNSFEKLLKFVELNKFENVKSEAVNTISFEERENDYKGANVSLAQKVYDSDVPKMSFTEKINNSEGPTVSFGQEVNVSIGPKVSFAEHLNVSLGDKVSFPATLGSLVAIFETVGNVTAQTCGGTLLSPRWVLTAAACVNLLGNLYNTANQTARSRYTVVANATNPLVDGSVHRVTRVALRPGPAPPVAAATAATAGLTSHLHDSKKVGGKETKETRTPVVALLRVEPAVRVDRLELLDERLPEGVDVAVYGWVPAKNASGTRSMRARSFPARTVQPVECERRYGLAPSRHTLCLNATADVAKGISQMSSGGAVLCARGGRVRFAGVAQAAAAERAPFLAYAVAAAGIGHDQHYT